MARVTALALSAILAAANAYDDGYMNVSSDVQPIQVRLAYQGPSAMAVSWNTFRQLKTPSVRYGLSPLLLLQYAQSTVSTTYPTSLTYNNHVNLTNLLPDTTYYYVPVNSDPSQKPLSFHTPKLAGDMSPYTVGAVVDMGTFGPLGLGTTTGVGAANPLKIGEQTTIQGIQQQLSNISFMIHPGDIAYADAWLKEEIQGYLPNTTIPGGALVYEHILNAFFDELEPITQAKPYMVAPGNHEANCDNGGTTDKVHKISYDASICMVGQTNFTGYRNHWRMPSGPSGGLENFWYSFDNGMVHWVSIDTETDLGHGLTGPDEGSPEFSGPFGLRDAQINWLTNDLASVDRQKTPWVIVMGHRPFYASTNGICANCSAAFEPLFHKYGVDLYFSGHSHVYERIAPIYQNVTDPNGLNNPNSTLYLINGAAGHYDGLDTFITPLKPYSRYAQAKSYSWSKLIFHNCTHLTHQAIASENGTVYDQVTLFKNRTCSKGFNFPTIPLPVPSYTPSIPIGY